MFRKQGLVDDLSDYIKKNLKKGYTKDSLRWALVNQGYSRFEVEKAIALADKTLASKAPILKTKPEITYTYEVADENKKFTNKTNFKNKLWKRLFG